MKSVLMPSHTWKSLAIAAAGMPLFVNWNKTFMSGIQGTQLNELFRNPIEPLVEEMRSALIASAELAERASS